MYAGAFPQAVGFSFPLFRAFAVRIFGGAFFYQAGKDLFNGLPADGLPPRQNARGEVAGRAGHVV